jgi:hypothetical protein
VDKEEVVSDILADLARAKAIFQARAIAAIIEAPPPVVKLRVLRPAYEENGCD